MAAITSRFFPRFATFVGLLAVAASAWGCTCSDEKVDPAIAGSLSPDEGIALSEKVSDRERADAAELLGKLRGKSFPERLVASPQNARLFLYIAAKSSEPNRLIAALSALEKAYAPTAGKGSKPGANQDYDKVVAAHLGSKDPHVLQAALGAASNAVRRPQPLAATLNALAQLAQSQPADGARIAAVSVLIRIPNYRSNRAVAAALLKSLEGKSPAVLSHLLFQLYQDMAKGLVQRPAYLARARALMAHPDPGVRGRAMRLAAVLAPKDAQVVAAVRRMLQDRHPYVRAVAAHALADMGDMASVHALVARATDFARTTHHVSYEKLGGGKHGIPHGDRNETVHEPIMSALERLTANSKEPFKRTVTKRDNTARQENVAKAKAWYDKHKTELPPAPSGEEPSKGAAEASKDEKGTGARAADAAKPAAKGAAASAPAGKPAAAKAPAPPAAQ